MAEEEKNTKDAVTAGAQKVADKEHNDEPREKAPYSGAPLAGKPEGVKSGAKLAEQVKEGLEREDPPVDAAPATATIRETNADGSATDSIIPNPGVDAPVAQDTSNTSDGSSNTKGSARKK